MLSVASRLTTGIMLDVGTFILGHLPHQIKIGTIISQSRFGGPAPGNGIISSINDTLTKAFTHPLLP